MTADTLHGSAFSVGRHPGGSDAGGLPRGSQHGFGKCGTEVKGELVGPNPDLAKERLMLEEVAEGQMELERERTRRAVAAAAGVLRHRTTSRARHLYDPRRRG